MVNKNLVNWIETEKSKGYDEEHISSFLVQTGKSEAEVREALDYVREKKSFFSIHKNLLMSAGGGVLIVVILIVILSSLQKNVVQEETPKQQNQTPANNPPPINVATTKNKERNLSEGVVACPDMNCFDKKFSECMPAEFTRTFNEKITVYYRIIGFEEDGCEVLSRFEKNPNPNFTGKDMFCVYDMAETFDSSPQMLNRCSGPLADVIKS